MITGYLAAEGFEDDLRYGLGEIIAEQHGRLFLTNQPPQNAAWAQNIWLNPQKIAIASIKDAAAKLRAIQRNWALYDYTLHRRASLITENLPHVSAKPITFLSPIPMAPLGSWCLVDENTMIASSQCSSPFKNGCVEFAEDKNSPPSRAYLKLWEFLTLIGQSPKVGEVCLDLGSSPGGWTWVLAGCGAKVISIDKAPLADTVASMPQVEYRQESAFALNPNDFEPVDWLFSDVICYPERLFTLVQRWMQSGKVRNFVCTIKFQGETDHKTAAAFVAIEGSTLRHLSHNKHELTWSLLR